MSDRKVKLLKNMALKEQARMPQFVQRQKSLIKEIDHLDDLLQRIKKLREEARSQDVMQAHRLQTNRWYELRLIEEMQTLDNKLEFLRTELEQVTATIAQIGHKVQLVSEKAQDAHRIAQRDRETKQEHANATPFRIKRT